MKRLDLISDALDGITNGNYNPRLTKEALAAARELRAMKLVAWYAQDNLGINDKVEVVWNSQKPAYAEVWIPLYTLGESNE